MDEEFIRNRITELRLKKGVSEYQMSMELGQNRSYIQAISSGRSMPSIHSNHKQVKNSNQLDKYNQNTHFFRFLSLSQRSISRWQIPTQGLP